MRFWDRIRIYRERGPAAINEPWTEVPAEDFHRLVTHILHPRLAAKRFERPSQTRWVRARLPEVRDIIEITALKGASYSAAWGLSLDFVPTIANGRRCSWHRTNKSARFDLVFDPLDYDRDTKPWSVTRLEHAEDLPLAMEEWASRVVPAAFSFFDTIATLQDVEAAFAAKAKRPYVRLGPQNYRQHYLAHAFVLGRLRRTAEAQDAFAKSLERFPLAPDIEARVRQEIGLDQPRPVA